jgi:hypothetical protein
MNLEQSMNVEFLTVPEVASLLKMSEDWVRDHAAPPPGRRARRNPTIPVYRIGSDKRAELRFRKADINTFMERLYVDGSDRVE